MTPFEQTILAQRADHNLRQAWANVFTYRPQYLPRNADGTVQWPTTPKGKS